MGTIRMRRALAVGALAAEAAGLLFVGGDEAAAARKGWSLPDGAVALGHGVYRVGKKQVNGVELECIAILDDGRRARARGGNKGKPDKPGSGGGSSCYSFLANGATYGYGGAIALSGSGPQIRNATIVNNAAILAGGIHCRDLSSPVIRASIMAFNMGTGAVYCDGEDTPDTQRSCVFQNDGGDILCGTSADILSLDPLFCNVNEDDLTLCSNSPCLPGGNPWGITIGDHGEGCSDCGSTLGGAPWRRWASTVAW